MDSRIDLEKAAEILVESAAHLRSRTLHVGELTWRDRETQRIDESQSAITSPDSFGIVIRSNHREGRLVLFQGGWADLAFYDSVGSTEIIEAVGVDDPLTEKSWTALVERFINLFVR